jgi:hypothetical protein
VVAGRGSSKILRFVCVVFATVKKRGWSRAPTIESLAFECRDVHSCSLAGARVNFGPLLVNLDFGERKGQLDFTSCSQVQLYTWIPGCLLHVCLMDATAMTFFLRHTITILTRGQSI